jgi:hypothetical protein
MRIRRRQFAKLVQFAKRLSDLEVEKVALANQVIAARQIEINSLRLQRFKTAEHALAVHDPKAVETQDAYLRWLDNQIINEGQMLALAKAERASLLPSAKESLARSRTLEALERKIEKDRQKRQRRRIED